MPNSTALYCRVLNSLSAKIEGLEERGSVVGRSFNKNREMEDIRYESHSESY